MDEVKTHKRTGPKPKSLEERFWEKVWKTPEPNGCWLWIARISTTGYGAIGITGSKSGWMKAHRVVWELTYGPIPEGMFVCHHCDVPICVRPDHLFLGTPLDNMRDMIKKCRQSILGRKCGEEHYGAVLTEEKVKEIRRSYTQESLTIASLAKMFGVSEGAITKVVKFRSWRHVV